ncbi:MAG: hypothetical protein ABEJ31_02615 [Haloarculaceae archaeon]
MTDAEREAEPRFAIPSRPERRYPRGGGVEYDGATVFSLLPSPERGDDGLRALLEGVLAGDRYTYGDWFDLPMPLYLVHDEGTGDVFRVAVRDGRVELHVLPATEPPGLRGLYQRLCDADESLTWRVECRVETA